MANIITKKKGPFEIAEDIFLILSVVFSVVFVYLAFLDLQNPSRVNFFLMIPFIFFLMPYLIIRLFKLKKVRQKMVSAPRFFRDFSDSMDSGRSVLSAIQNLKNGEYGVLNEDIVKLSNQLEWGVSFEEAILKFSDNIGSLELRRDILLIIEARKIGGHIEKILKELSEKLDSEISRNKKRRSDLASNTLTGYISFCIFLIIIVITFNSLFEGSIFTQEKELEGEISLNPLDKFLSLLIILSFEIAILSGLLFGLMGENSILAGVPHTLALTVITFLTYFFFVV